MGKQVFVPFDLKPQDIKSLTPYDKQHLLNHTIAWIDQSTEDVQSIRTVIIPLILGLLGGFLLFYMVSNFFTNFFIYPPYEYEESIISSVLLTLAVLNSKQISLFQIRQVKHMIGTIGNSQKPVRFYFLNDHINQLLTNQTQTLINACKRIYIRKQGFQALLYIGLAVFGCLFPLLNTGHTHNGYIHIGGLTHVQIIKFVALINCILLLPSVAFLILSIKKLVGIRIANSR